MRTLNHPRGTAGFTLIELLIVIGLLGALTALVLPSLMADREEAMGAVCDYNQAGTVRVVKEYVNLYNSLPDDLHNGLQGTDATAVAMEGLPSAQTDHMVTYIDTTRHALTEAEAESLIAAGVDSICYGTGLQSVAVAEGVNVADASDGPWFGDDGAEMTFDGIPVSDWAVGTLDDGTTPTPDGGLPGTVVVLWVAPTVDWTPDIENANQDWTGGAVQLSVDMEGQCPIPAEDTSGEEVSFAYYMIYVKVYQDYVAGVTDATPARMIGSTCPECGVLNP